MANEESSSYLNFNFSLRAKLFSGVALVTLMLLGLGGYFVYGLFAVNGDVNEYEETSREIQTAQKLQLHVANVWQFYTDASLTRDESVIKEEAQPQLERAQEKIAQLLKMNQNEPEHHNKLKQLQEDLTQLKNVGQKMFEAYGKNQRAGNRVMGQYDEAASAVIEKTSQLSRDMKQNGTNQVNRIGSYIHWLSWSFAFAIAGVVLITVLLNWLNIHLITSPLITISEKLRKMANGDLTQEPSNYSNNDEIGTISTAYNQLLSNLKSFMENVKQTVTKTRTISQDLDDTARELNESSQELAEDAEEQSSSLQETSSSVEEMASMLNQNTDNAKKCDDLSNDTRDLTLHGVEKIDELKKMVDQIREDSKKISEVIEVVDDIAFQTNLLALNAAVEAANAGKHGEGFAVVADEVGQLAQRSGEAADEVGEIIEHSTERTKEGVQLADESREALTDIEEGVIELSDRIQEIAAASDQQARGIEEINKSVTQLETVMERNTENAQKTANSSDELAEQSDRLQQMVNNLENLLSNYTT